MTSDISSSVTRSEFKFDGHCCPLNILISLSSALVLVLISQSQHANMLKTETVTMINPCTSSTIVMFVVIVRLLANR